MHSAQKPRFTSYYNKFQSLLFHVHYTASLSQVYKISKTGAMVSLLAQNLHPPPKILDFSKNIKRMRWKQEVCGLCLQNKQMKERNLLALQCIKMITRVTGFITENLLFQLTDEQKTTEQYSTSHLVFC